MYSTSRRKHFMDAMNEDPATNAAAKIRRYLNRDLFVDGKNSNGSSRIQSGRPDFLVAYPDAQRLLALRA